MMSAIIHPTALVAEGVKLAEGVSIGAYSIIGSHVVLGEHVKIHSHVVIEGHTTIGARTEIFPFAAIGFAPQNRYYKGEPSEIYIGEGCVIREHVTIHPGTEEGGMKTTVGNYCNIMIGSHIAHDCHVGNYVTMANNATIGGHVTIGDYTNIGGLAAIHQFVRIGPYAMISGTAGVNEDIMPFGAVMAIRGRLGGVNIIGMKRRGFDNQDIHNLRNAYKILAKDQEGTLEERLQKIRSVYGDCRAVKELLDFIDIDSKKPLCLPVEAWEFDLDGAEGRARAATA